MWIIRLVSALISNFSRLGVDSILADDFHFSSNDGLSRPYSEIFRTLFKFLAQLAADNKTFAACFYPFEKFLSRRSQIGAENFMHYICVYDRAHPSGPYRLLSFP